MYIHMYICVCISIYTVPHMDPMVVGILLLTRLLWRCFLHPRGSRCPQRDEFSPECSWVGCSGWLGRGRMAKGLHPRSLTAIAPGKWWLEDIPFLWGWPIFRGYIKLPGSTWMVRYRYCKWLVTRICQLIFVLLSSLFSMVFVLIHPEVITGLHQKCAFLQYGTWKDFDPRSKTRARHVFRRCMHVYILWLLTTSQHITPKRRNSLRSSSNLLQVLQ